MVLTDLINKLGTYVRPLGIAAALYNCGGTNATGKTDGGDNNTIDTNNCIDIAQDIVRACCDYPTGKNKRTSACIGMEWEEYAARCCIIAFGFTYDRWVDYQQKTIGECRTHSLSANPHMEKLMSDLRTCEINYCTDQTLHDPELSERLGKDCEIPFFKATPTH